MPNEKSNPIREANNQVPLHKKFYLKPECVELGNVADFTGQETSVPINPWSLY